MKNLHGWLARFLGLFNKQRKDRDFENEINSHLQMHIDDNLRSGMTSDEARRQAMIKFGAIEATKEAYRDQRSLPALETLLQDIRYGVRSLLKNPGFTIVALVTLTLGIGSGTAVFSLANAILLRGLPVPNSEELRVIQWSGTDVRMSSFEGTPVQEGNRWVSAACVTHPGFLLLREQCTNQAILFGFYPIRDAAVKMKDATFAADGTMVSDNFFSGLQIQPSLGRVLGTKDDYAGNMNVVISHAWWQKHFGGNPEVIGRVVTLNGANYTVIGVLSRGFAGVKPGSQSDFYVPMAAGAPFLYTPINENWHWFVHLMARLKPGIVDGQLRSALEVAFTHETSAMMKEPKILVEPGRGGLAFDRNSYGKPLRLMLGVVGLVMLVACANLAGLSLARGAARQHELSVRSALGAGRWRLIRQLLTESLVLGAVSTGGGVLLAIWGRAVLGRLLAGSTVGLKYDFSLDATVLLFSLALALGTALLSGLWPSFRASRVAPASGLKSRGSLGAPRLRSGRLLVAVQICLSLILLTGAGLYARTLINLSHVNAGFDVDRLLVVGLDIRASAAATAGTVPFFERAQSAIATIPGVQSATLVGFPLLANRNWGGGFQIRGRQMPQGASASRLAVSETFFSTFGIPILQGRGFQVTDNGEAPKVVVVNESFVRNDLPAENPLGLIYEMLGEKWQIVGVCRDAKYDHIRNPPGPVSYFPYRQMFYRPSLGKNFHTASAVVRTTVAPLGFSSVVRKALAQIDPDVSVVSITSQKELRDQGISQERLLATLCGFLAILTVLLSCIGLYGLMAYNVARRTSEIAVRMAVGARRIDVAKPILREALILSAIGIGAGLPAILLVSRLIKNQLYGVAPNDLVTPILGSLALLLVALLAAWIPARRATRIEPIIALRAE